jgi:hypothetical protein
LKELHLFGCSFTERVTIMVGELFEGKFECHNHGKNSANNFYILKKFRDVAPKDSICIIQWSSLTRPFDENFSLVETSDNPLYDLLEQWYIILKEAQRIAKNRNIKLIQFVGWAVWKDEELNDYHREKLRSFDITWFESSPQWDLITSNCFQFQQPNQWSSNKNENGLHYWDKMVWGGMSEWIRENVDIKDRYTYVPEHERNGGEEWDPHPSPIGYTHFYNNVIFPKIL